jgi:hypothetical protein
MGPSRSRSVKPPIPAPSTICPKPERFIGFSRRPMGYKRVVRPLYRRLTHPQGPLTFTCSCRFRPSFNVTSACAVSKTATSAVFTTRIIHRDASHMLEMARTHPPVCGKAFVSCRRVPVIFYLGPLRSFLPTSAPIRCGSVQVGTTHACAHGSSSPTNQGEQGEQGDRGGKHSPLLAHTAHPARAPPPEQQG